MLSKLKQYQSASQHAHSQWDNIFFEVETGKKISPQCLKVGQIWNDFFKPRFLPKNEWINSTLLLVDLFLFIFWKKMKWPKIIFEIKWPLSNADSYTWALIFPRLSSHRIHDPVSYFRYNKHGYLETIRTKQILLAWIVKKVIFWHLLDLRLSKILITSNMAKNKSMTSKSF